MSSDSPIRSSSVVPQKRARPVRSCLRCRNKKLKCDRQHPCALCVKFNRAEHCSYDERVGSMGQFPEETVRLQATTSSTTLVEPSLGYPGNPLVANDAIRDLQKRVDKLEGIVSQAGSVRNLDLENRTIVPTHGNSTAEPSQGTKRRYLGLSNTRTLISLFPGAVTFVDKALADPEMQTDFQDLRRMFPKEKVGTEQSGVVGVESIMASIPPREVCDQLVQFYTRNFESSYQILHLPTFLGQYERFWHPEGQTSTSSSVEFQLQLALVVVLGSGLNQFKSLTATSTSANLDARATCTKIDAWISSLKGKQRMRLSTFQTSCLLVLAKQMLCAPSTELWRCTGDLIRSALEMGLHRDPDQISDAKMPLFQAEIRRRLWYTAAELDVQVSISCCMPSLVQSIDYNCRCPAAILDDDLTAETRAVPNRAQYIDEMDNFAQATLAPSLPLRLRALRLLCQSQPNPVEIFRTLEDLEAQRAFLHQATKATTDASEPNRILKSIVLDMCYRKPMMSLYTYGLQNSEYLRIQGDHETAKKCIDLCMGIMSHSCTLDPELSDHESISDCKYWEHLQSVNGEDVIRAAYMACYAMELSHSNSLNIVPVVPPRTGPNSALHWPNLAVRRMVEDVVGTFIKGSANLRDVLKQLMGLALVSSLTKHTGSESRREDLMRLGLQNVLQQCRERHAAAGSKELNLDDDSDSLLFGVSPDVFDQFMSQDFGLDTMDLDWDFDSFAGVNSQPPLNDQSNPLV